MAYGVVWRYETPESGLVRRLMSTPESLAEVESIEVARDEGRQMMSELASEHKSCIKPLSVVEVNEHILGALCLCPTFTLPAEDADDEDAELEFIDVGETVFWASQPWWHR